jgi:hypothetical protein
VEVGDDAGGVRWRLGRHRLAGRWINGGSSGEVRVSSCRGGAALVGLEVVGGWWQTSDGRWCGDAARRWGDCLARERSPSDGWGRRVDGAGGRRGSGGQ